MALKKAFVSALASYHPPEALDNRFFERALADVGGTSAQWIVDKVGIEERRVMASYRGDRPVFEIAKRAVEQLLAGGTDLHDVDLILSCSSTDDLQYPGTANLISEAFSLHVPAFHLKNGCATVLFGLETARAFLQLGYRNVLIVNGEPFTTQVDYRDRKSCILFGDASTAMVVTSEESSRNLLELVDLRLGGRGSQVITSTAPGAQAARTVHQALDADRNEKTPEAIAYPRGVFHQAGKEVFDWVLKTMPDTIHSFLKHNGRDLSSVAYFVGHQSNLNMLESVRETLGLPPEKHLCNIQRFGNVSSAGWVSVLDDALRQGRFKSEDEILVSVFGAGLAWGNALLKVV